MFYPLYPDVKHPAAQHCKIFLIRDAAYNSHQQFVRQTHPEILIHLLVQICVGNTLDIPVL